MFELFFNKTCKQVVSYNNHNIYLVNWKNINKLVGLWKYNRPPDKNRVEKIKNYIETNNYVPGIIYLAEIDDKLYCYDGNHRREALNLTNKDYNVLIDVMFNSTHLKTKQIFNDINKAISVADIYINNENDKDNLEVKQQIQKLVIFYEKKYKHFISVSSRYRSPNFQRDAFINQVYEIHNNLNVSVEKIQKVLSKMNELYCSEVLSFNKPKNKYNVNTLKKCEKHNFWLFIDRKICTKTFNHVLDKYFNSFC